MNETRKLVLSYTTFRSFNFSWSSNENGKSIAREEMTVVNREEE